MTDKKDKIIDLLSHSVSELLKGREIAPVCFSGGVDSYIIAALINKNAKPLLYTIGNKKSKDIIYSKIASDALGAPLRIIEFTDQDIINGLEKTMKIIGSDNSMDILIGTIFYLIAKRMHEDGFDFCFSGQGADELFYGYDKYRRAITEGKDPILLRNNDVFELKEILKKREYKIYKHFGIDFMSPFLDEKLTKTALDLDISLNLKNQDDNLRKHVLREIAFQLGAPEDIINRKKKALQYGSGILEEIRRISKEKGIASSLNAYLEYIKKQNK